MVRFSTIVLLLVTFTTRVYANGEGQRSEECSDQLIAALIAVESKGDDGAVGDKHLKDKAYGCLQIRQPCVDDVNRRCGTSYKAADCLNDRELSIWICKQYLSMYATKERLGREVTDEDRARIWNGGPSGWKKTSTTKYWKKVKRQLGELSKRGE